MTIERYKNDAVTQLDGAIDGTQLTIDVIDAAVFPTLTGGDQFRIRIDDEEDIIVSSVASNTLTVTRGTGATSHSDGSDVAHNLTADGLLNVPADVANLQTSETDTAKRLAPDGSGGVQFVSGSGGTVDRGAYASRPAAGSAGTVYIATDTPIWSYDTGAAWIEYYGTRGLVNDTFPSTWVNQGSATTDTTLGGVYLETPTNGSTNLRLLTKTAPTRPYTITIAVLRNVTQPNGLVFLGWRQSSDGKLTGISATSSATSTDSRWKFISRKYNSATSASTDYFGIDIPYTELLFLRIKEDTSNRIVYWSGDGIHWITMHTVGRTDFLTADQVCIGLEAGSTTPPVMGAWFLSWDEA